MARGGNSIAKMDGVFIAIHRKPHTVLRRFAAQPRTVFSGAPCLKLSEDGYNPDEQTAFPFKIGEIERVSMPKSSVPIGKTGQATSPK